MKTLSDELLPVQISVKKTTNNTQNKITQEHAWIIYVLQGERGGQRRYWRSYERMLERSRKRGRESRLRRGR
ncbi:hypothetical protein DVH24_003276 [Malus domestica]|uniref:Uncharacterized protein n=1 Tax=Malus domestica TaxID=3750 RepID=A0A498IGQ0_MALDO|nr:hypothetical protein DVH24_003276 [Malus domestica]